MSATSRAPELCLHGRPSTRASLQVVPASPLAAAAPEAPAARVVIELVAAGAREEQALVPVAVSIGVSRCGGAKARIAARGETLLSEAVAEEGLVRHAREPGLNSEVQLEGGVLERERDSTCRLIGENVGPRSQGGALSEADVGHEIGPGRGHK